MIKFVIPLIAIVIAQSPLHAIACDQMKVRADIESDLNTILNGSMAPIQNLQVTLPHDSIPGLPDYMVSFSPSRVNGFTGSWIAGYSINPADCRVKNLGGYLTVNKSGN